MICARGAKIKEFPALVLSQDKIVDSNGAGDAFVGGFLSQFIVERSLEECIKCGLWSASVSLQHVGCNFEHKSNYISIK